MAKHLFDLTHQARATSDPGHALGRPSLELTLDPMDMHDVPCGLDFALFVVGGKWKPVIVYHLRSGPHRFRDLRRRVSGISARVLSQQLRELAATDILVRHDHQQSTPRVDYTLTPFGMTLVEAILPLCAWGLEHRDQIAGMVARASEREDWTC